MFRIAIVDDESYVRMGLKTIAEKEGKYTVVGEADNGASAVQMIMQKQPNAVFLDITIPGLDGMEVLKEIRQRGYSGHVTMLTCHDEFRLVQQALRLGADDYVLKNDLAEESFSQYLKRLSARQNGDGRRKTTSGGRTDSSAIQGQFSSKHSSHGLYGPGNVSAGLREPSYSVQADRNLYPDLFVPALGKPCGPIPGKRPACVFPGRRRYRPGGAAESG